MKEEVKGLEQGAAGKGSAKRGRAEFEESLAVNETVMPVSSIYSSVLPSIERTLRNRLTRNLTNYLQKHDAMSKPT